MNMKKRNNLRKDERAVSPVIGVILMVAITVIMAAIIGAFVYGYGGSMTQMKDVSATARHQDTTIYATYMGGPDDNLVLELSATIECPNATDFTNFGTGVPSVGDQATCENAAIGQNSHVVVVANFTDGSSQVILDSFC